MKASDTARAALVAAMQRLAAGERDALGEIYRATHVKLFGICLRILKDRKEAEDALQDVYVTLWRRAGRFDPERASPISWLATFARNRAVDRLRIGKVRSGAVPVEAADTRADETPLAVDQLIDAENAARIHGCLSKLEDPPREDIREAFLGGASYGELAARKDVPLGTMKSRIRRGLMKLRTCMEAGE